ncbi:MAG TPA: CHAD domain-containing protein [Solirubrobacterales bacterium]|nr:CHAD domain-containing protein [Solirubrobacterales bacterium]
MAEIERKFLVEEMPGAESGRTEIEQGYLMLAEETEVRLRRAGDERFLTAKSGSGEVREEVEVPIEPRAFEKLWPLTAGRRVRKVRHYVPVGEGLRAEVDVYEGGLDGLRTAEVEFDSREQADRFTPPPWFGKELTGDERYANRALATVGLPAEADVREHVLMETASAATDEAQTEPEPQTEAEDAAPAPSRAYRLRDDEEAGAGVRRVIVGRLEKAAERLREPSDGDALAEAIHGARKDLKKARAALRLVREDLGEKTFKQENRALRDAGRMLSASRDAEVKVETLESLVEGDAGDAPPGPTALWREALIADRDRIVDADADQTEAAVAAIEEVLARAPDWELRHTGWKLLAPGLDAAYRDGRETFEALSSEPDFEAVHELRKRGKDLWYQVRLLRDAWAPVLEPTAEEIHEFTDLLGDHHDLAVLGEDLGGREEIGGAHGTILRSLIEAEQIALLVDARALGARIYAEKPKAFGRRLRAYWRARQRPF